MKILTTPYKLIYHYFGLEHCKTVQCLKTVVKGLNTAINSNILS